MTLQPEDLELGWASISAMAIPSHDSSAQYSCKSFRNRNTIPQPLLATIYVVVHCWLSGFLACLRSPWASERRPAADSGLQHSAVQAPGTQHVPGGVRSSQLAWVLAIACS
jgi:hypothetical protein